MDYLSIYSQAGELLGVLENASGVGYELKHNDLWTGQFTLPAGDEKNALCQAHNIVRLPDGERDTGLFRIVGMPESEESALGGTRTYQLEHVMATLLDDVLFGYHEIGGTGIYTADVIRYILARQETVRWQLGDCEYNDQYQYHFENVSLLSALLSIGETLAEEYTWDFDTSTEPWTVSLRKADDEDGCGILYRRNLKEIHKSMDASALVTRLYPLGYGEGVNQLTIRDVNDNVPYIDADTVSVWGVKASVWTDTRIEDAGLLKARARQVLEGYKNPYISYTATAVDLYRLTGQSWDKFMPGKLVRATDGEHGIQFSARIVSVRKGDVKGSPGGVEITIANAPRDAADSINTLADRVGIGELYSQGATNLFAIPFADNADATHPAKMRVYLPEGLVRINKMLLSFQATAFRSYETATESGGGSTPTSASGGGSTATSSSTEQTSPTSEAAGEATVSTPETVFEPSGDAGTTSAPKKASGVDQSYTDYEGGDMETGEAGSHSHTVNSHSHTGPSHSHGMGHDHTGGSHYHGMEHIHKENGGHNHSVSSGSTATGDAQITTAAAQLNGRMKSYTDSASATVGYYSGNTDSGGTGNTGSASPGTDSQGKHKHTYKFNHRHEFAHYHTITKLKIPALSITVPSHTHTVTIPGHSHTVQIPAHTHSVTIPAHTHQMAYGIYEGSTARTVTVMVDGQAVPAASIVNGEVDVIPWLDKDEAGKVTRGCWHEIQMVPDTLTRIEANLTAQVFIQSVGGGNF